jgi:hypothetical protein
MMCGVALAVVGSTARKPACHRQAVLASRGKRPPRASACPAQRDGGQRLINAGTAQRHKPPTGSDRERSRSAACRCAREARARAATVLHRPTDRPGRLRAASADPKHARALPAGAARARALACRRARGRHAGATDGDQPVGGRGRQLVLPTQNLRRSLLPITTGASIDTSLRQVWASLAPHLSARRRELCVLATQPACARRPAAPGGAADADVDRTREEAGVESAPALVTATIEVATPGSITLTMEAEPKLAPDEDESTDTLIETLCRELAAKIGATLSCTHPRRALLHHILVMSNADHQALPPRSQTSPVRRAPVG